VSFNPVRPVAEAFFHRASAFEWRLFYYFPVTVVGVSLIAGAMGAAERPSVHHVSAI
jgi:hypothetical protein